MKKYLGLFLAVFAFANTACSKSTNEVSIVPQPQSVVVARGSLVLPGATVSYDKGFDDKAVQNITKFADRLSLVTGKQSQISNVLQESGVSFAFNQALAPEEYEINVTPKNAKISASSVYGVMYAIQSLYQMLPVAVYGDVAAETENWTIPCLSIKDKPRFAYRGMHLDVARHFFSVDEVKKYLDIMARYKMNRFHWHLTDDQGWRIEIKKYPKLTEIGSIREATMVGHLKSNDEEVEYDGTPYGGFYTQDQIREIVKYADDLGIVVIPEIDLPGHMVAALTAYPELGCTGGPYKVWGRWGISKDVLCVGKENTFKFIEDVLTEVMELFPSEYIHIGGDECPKDAWAKCPNCQRKIKELGLKADDKHSAEQYLQSYVTERVQSFLNSKGRKIIGWDEILEGKLAEGATVMSWRGVAGGIQAASEGFDAIMTPNSYLYFDYFQSGKKDLEPLGIGGFLPVDTVYSYEPFKGLPEEARKHILGVQANLWTEYVATPEHLEYNLLPRMAALAEVQWTLPENKNFELFKKKVTEHEFKFYDARKYNYSKAIIGEYGMEYKKAE